MGMKQRSFFFEKNIQNGGLKKTDFFKIANSQIFFVKILIWIGPWLVQLIDVKGIDVAQPIWP